MSDRKASHFLIFSFFPFVFGRNHYSQVNRLVRLLSPSKQERQPEPLPDCFGVPPGRVDPLPSLSFFFLVLRRAARADLGLRPCFFPFRQDKA